MSSSTLEQVYTKVEYLDYNLCYNKEFKIIICKDNSCNTCLNSSKTLLTIEEHLTKKHKVIKDSNFNRFLLSLRNKTILPRENLSIPSNYNYLFKDLKEPISAFICKLCLEKDILEVSTAKNPIQRHLNIEYNINNKHKNLTLEDYIDSSNKVQSFYNKKDLINYFITKPTFISTTIEEQENNNNNSILLNYKRIREEQENSFIADYSKLQEREIPTIIRKTYFNKYLGNKDLKYLLSLIVIPIEKGATNKDNIEYIIFSTIKNICYSIDTTIDKLQRRLKQQLATDRLNTEINKNLKDYSVLEPNSKRRYYSYFARFFIYLIRVYLLKKDNIEAKEQQPYLGNLLESKLELVYNNCSKYYNKTLLYSNNIKENPREKEEYLDKQAKLKAKLLKSITTISIEIVDLLLAQSTGQISLIEHATFNSPLITYLAIQSYNNKAIPKQVSYIQQEANYLIYVLRLFSISIIDNKYSKLKEINNNITIDSIFLDYYKQNLTFNSNNCFEELIQIRGYCKAIANNTMPKPRIRDISLDLISIDNKDISLPKLFKFYRTIEDRLEEILFSKLLMLNSKDLTLDINSLLDNIHNNTPFFYFAKDYNSNSSLNLEDKEDFLINRLSNKYNYFSNYFIKAQQNNSPIYNKENINNYLDNRIEFIKLLGVALYLLAAAPIRGTEVEVIKYYNTIEYGERNLFIDNKTKLFRIETSYCKTNNITNKDNNIVRFLSPKLSSILKVYLLFVIPFYNFINITIFNNKTINPYILEYKGKILSSSFISNYLGNLTQELLGNRITINSYRQFYKYLVKSRLPNYNIDLGLELDIEEENSNNIEEILFNHNTRTSLQNYAQEYSLFRNKNSSLEQRSIDFTTAVFNFIGLKSFNFNINKEFFNYLELENIKDNPSSSKRARSNTTLSNIATIFAKKSKSNTIEYSSSSSSIEEEEEIENNTFINTSPTKRNRSTTISSLDTSKINKKQRIISISSSSSSSILEELDINKEKIIPNKAPKQVLLKNKRLSNKQPIQQIEEEEENSIDNLDLYSFSTPKKASRTIKRLKGKKSIIAINKPKGFIENKEKEYNYNSNSSSLEEEEEKINNNNNIATIDKSKQTKAISYIEELEEEPSNSYIQDYFNSIVEEDNNSIIESNNSIREDNNSIIEDNNSFIEENNSIIEDNNSIIEDNSSIIEDNNIFTDIDNYSSFSKQIEQLDLTTKNSSSSIFTSKFKNTLSFSPKKNSNLEYSSLINTKEQDNNSILSSSNNSIYSNKEIELFSSPLQSKQSKVKDTSINISISLENRLEIVKERIKLRKLQNKEINTIKKPLVFYLNKLYKRINIETNSFTTIKQEEAINAVIDLKPFITYISKTGGGKSNLFFLPSFIYPFRAFIVVVPRVSLLQDLYSRSKDFKLNSTIFSIDNINTTNYNLIFISLEDFNSLEFIDYTSNLKEIYSNITIFLEETHLLLLEEDFRNVLKDINKVVTLKLQLVFITATLPSLLQDLLELKFYLDSNLVIRESTTQDKIQYITIPFKGNSINSLKHFYKQELELASKEEKIIIYVNTKVEGLELAKILNINYYFSAKTKEDKENNSNKLVKFLDFNSNSKAIIATSALLVGIDYP